MSLPENGTKALWGAIIAHSALLITLIGWVVLLSYNAGERARQMDINTSTIHDINEHGSSGLTVWRQEIEKRLDELQSRVDEMQSDTNHRFR